MHVFEPDSRVKRVKMMNVILFGGLARIPEARGTRVEQAEKVQKKINSMGEAIAIRLEAIAIRLETIPIRLEAIPIRLEAIAIRLEAIAIRLALNLCVNSLTPKLPGDLPGTAPGA